MKVTWGMMITDGSGKLGGHVAAKNRGGNYVRTKVKPSNPKTPAQQDARNRLSTFSQNWRGLTEDERLAWNNATANFPEVKNGKVIYLSGQQLYVKLNSNLSVAGQTAIDTPPLPAEMPSLALTALVSDVSSMTSTISASDAVVPSGF
ncbi:MAG TPA: hypothetical protein VGF75_03285, partial [Candidatus Saccharimonadales bacterium]